MLLLKCTLVSGEMLMDYGEERESEHQTKSWRCRFVD